MANPMLAQLIGSNANSFLGSANSVKQMLSGQDPNAVFQQLMMTNPKFKEFVMQNQGKSPEQIAAAYGIDFNQVRNLFG